MQFSVSTLAIAMLAVRAQAAIISSRQVDATINLYNSANCQNYQTTWTWSDEHGSNGGCQAISASSAEVTSLFGSCTGE
jgi:predicted porin